MPDDLGTVVDVHQHWLPRELADTMERQLPDGYRVVRDDSGTMRVFDGHGMEVFTLDVDDYSSVTQRLADMDSAGIDVALLSASCYPSWITLRAARLLNDAAGNLMRGHGERLRPMVHVPPFGEDGILEEMERGANLGLRGVCICTNFAGRYPDDDAYLPFLEKAAELDFPIFIHAAGSPVHTEGLQEYDLTRTLGRSIDHCLVVVRMLYSGVMAKIPGLKLVINHLGGSFFANTRRYLTPSFAEASGAVHGYGALLDRMLFDTAPSFWYGPADVECAVKNLGIHRIALGTDYPVLPGASTLAQAVAHVDALPFPSGEKQRLRGANARALYRL